MLSSRLLISLIFLAYYSINVYASQQCHYTCLNCTQASYTSCLACHQGQISYWPLNSIQKTGICSHPIESNINILGMVMLFTLIIFCCFIRSQFIFYFLFYYQTCGTLYFVEVNWNSLINYLLVAFTYLMPIATVSSHVRGYKQAVQCYYKEGQYFKSINFYANLAFLGPINAFLMILIILIPMFKAFRDRFVNDRSSVITDGTLDNLWKIIKTSFLILIQQTCLTIFFCLSNSQRPLKTSQIVITIVYFLFLTFFVLYHCFQILPIFRTKMSQFLIIISRIIVPLFILLDKKYHFLCPILAIIFFFWEMILNSKNKQNRQINKRILGYKFIGIIIFGLFLIFYFLQIKLNNETISKIFGTILFSITIIGIDIIYIEAFVQIKTYCCQKYLSSSITTKLSFSNDQQLGNKRVQQSIQAFSQSNPINFTHQTQEIIDYPHNINITFQEVPQLQRNIQYKKSKQGIVQTKRAKISKYQQQVLKQLQRIDENQEIKDQIKDQIDPTFIFPFKQLIEDSTQK